MVYPQRNMQPSGGFGKELYKGRGRQIVWRAGSQNFREGVQNNWREQRLGRDPNAIDVDREKGGQDMLYVQKMGLYSQKLLAKEEKRRKSSRNTTRVGKRQWRTVNSQLAFSNIYSVLYPEKLENKVSCQDNTKRVRDIWYILHVMRAPKREQFPMYLNT